MYWTNDVAKVGEFDEKGDADIVPKKPLRYVFPTFR